MVARAERSGTPQQVLVGPRRPAAAPIRPPPRTVGPHRQPACPRGPGEPAGPAPPGRPGRGLPTWTRRVSRRRGATLIRVIDGLTRAGAWVTWVPGCGCHTDQGACPPPWPVPVPSRWLPHGPGSLGRRRWWSWLRGCPSRHPPARSLSARTVLIARENGTCSPRERYLFVVRTDGASGCLWVRVARSARQWVLGGPGAWWLWDSSGAPGQSFEEAVCPGSGRLGAVRVVSGHSSRWFMRSFR